ncbi:MAG: type II toxin-antitoxin system Phd/YefM family antitoxin [Lachnospiraceae bacterium]
MPSIKPISDLRNYTEVLKAVSINNPVYLTRNGRDEYAIIKSEELDQLHAKVKLLANIQNGYDAFQGAGDFYGLLLFVYK